MHDPTAKAISTVGIWLAVSVILTFGVFHSDWNGPPALVFLMLIVAIICSTAGVATAAVWGKSQCCRSDSGPVQVVPPHPAGAAE